MGNVHEAESALQISNGWLIKFADSDVGGRPNGPMWFGKGKGKFWMWAKGKGKGKSDGHMMLRVDPTYKVWLGDLPDGVSWKDLQTHMNEAGKTTWVEVFTGTGKGTGAVVYATPEEATNAIEKLNGSEIMGQAIIVDVWSKQAKPEENDAEPSPESVAAPEVPGAPEAPPAEAPPAPPLMAPPAATEEPLAA